MHNHSGRLKRHRYAAVRLITGARPSAFVKVPVPASDGGGACPESKHSAAVYKMRL